MKLLFAFVFSLLTSSTVLSQGGKPNFVVFLVDDLGWGDLGCYGSTFHETPHLDQLAASGMKFTNAYSACTVCSPSRAAIMTGQYPARLHLTDWITGHGRRNPRLLIPDWKMKLDHDLTTLPEALKEADYKTQFVGKWHLMPIGKPEFDQHFPDHHGFDTNIAGREWGQPKGRGKYFSPFDMPNLDNGNEGDFLTDKLTDAAIDFIDQSRDAPFLLYFSYYTVHGPIMAKPDLVKKYSDKAKTFTNTKNERVHPPYAGMVESLDDSVGRILAKLQETGLTENTVVIFTADNGGTSPQSSGGLRGAKALAYEGGTREPFIVKWPGKIKPGSSCDEPVIGNDIYPTLLDAAGLAPKPQCHKDGLSIVPLLTGKAATLPRDSLFWHYPHYHKTAPYGAIRRGDWKLIEFFENGSLELYDLKNDPAESINLAGKETRRTESLHAALIDWRKSVGAQMPRTNPDYDPDFVAPRKRNARKRNQPVRTPLGTARASSHQAGNPPQAALDGEHNSRWAGDGPSVPQWWSLEFPEACDLTGLKIHWKNKTWFHYRIETSLDGRDWLTQVDESKSKEERKLSEHIFEQKTKFLRITVNALGSGWVSFTEVEPLFSK